MGLHIHSLGELPVNVERGYYLYLLDYGWKEPISDALYRNFDRMANLASQNDAVVMRGVVGSHFADEVLSWHHVNGRDAQDLLPAILVTTRHPRTFFLGSWSEGEEPDRLLIIPLRSVCDSAEDLIPLIEKLFADIKAQKSLSDFEIADEMHAGSGEAVLDALILQPNISGLGVDVKKLINFFRGQ